ncbi:MAG: sensor histidine kinase [Bdellovibrionota bacterium]
MPNKISERLEQNIEKVMLLWEKRVVKEVPSAHAVTPLLLKSTLSVYLAHLSEALSINRKLDFRSVLAHDKESIRIGKVHGRDRAGSVNYVLTEMISEYHILRQVLFQFLEEGGHPLSPEQRDIILDSIEQAVNDAAVNFTEIHADIQQKFVNTLTHDLQTPISAAKLNAELILKRSGKPEASIISASRIVVSLNRLTSMIHDLLDGSRLRAGEVLNFPLIECDLDSVIREVVDEMSIVHGDRFVLYSEEQIIGQYGCDGLKRTVENLMGNAVKYSTPQTPITVSLKKVDTSVRLTVHNEGVAIPEKEQPILFQQFRRAKSAQEGAKTGWGLGLTLVKGVVDSHKGTVRVESATGRGTSFIIEMPQNPVIQPPKSQVS